MATSITTLALDIAAEKAVAAAAKKLAPIGKFATSFAAAEAEKGDTVKVPVFEAQTAEEFGNDNNYTSASDAGVAGVGIELENHPWSSKRLLPDDAMETDAGREWVEKTAVKSVEACAAAVVAKTMNVLCTATNHKTLNLSGTDIIKIVGQCRKQIVKDGLDPADATLILSSDKFTDLLESLKADVIGRGEAFENGFVDHLLGFARIVEADATYKTGSGESEKTYELNVAVVMNDAIGIATRLPKVQNPDQFEVSTVQKQEIGPWSFQLRSTGSNSNDAKFLGAEVIYGVKALKPTEIYTDVSEVTA